MCFVLMQIKMRQQNAASFFDYINGCTHPNINADSGIRRRVCQKLKTVQTVPKTQRIKL